MADNANKAVIRAESSADFLMYTSADGGVRVEVFLHDETIWLTQNQIAELFGILRTSITKHLQNIFNSGELDEKVVSAIFALTTPHGAMRGKTQTREVNLYNLDAIIAVGYRVNSKRATQFRIWATSVIKEYMIKGFALDDERLKNGRHFGKDYFRELLERVRSIRASERRIWQQITDIFAECSSDYDRKAPTTRDFYASVQNKFHYAIAGKTAPEIIHEGADKSKPAMGLQNWKNAPRGRILKSDTTIAKNYLSESEIKRLERSVGAFFDYIENQIEQQKGFKMAGFAQAVDKFLTFNNFEVLTDKGSISHDKAKTKAHAEYDEFNQTQAIDSDFDKLVKKTIGKQGDDKRSRR